MLYHLILPFFISISVDDKPNSKSKFPQILEHKKWLKSGELLSLRLGKGDECPRQGILSVPRIEGYE